MTVDETPFPNNNEKHSIFTTNEEEVTPIKKNIEHEEDNLPTTTNKSKKQVKKPIHGSFEQYLAETTGGGLNLIFQPKPYENTG